MVINYYTNLTPPDADDLNITHTLGGQAQRQVGLNAIQQLQDRAVTFSADGGQFVEAYIDASGRNNDVDTSQTTANFDTDKYKYVENAGDIESRSSDAQYSYNPPDVSNTTSLRFNDDGTKAYFTEATNDVYEYTLAIAYDLTSGTLTHTYDATSQTTSVHCVVFKSDGTVMYLLDEDAETIYQYTLSSAWDLSTASYATKTVTITDAVITYQMFMQPDGTKMFISSYGTGVIREYNISTPYDISTMSTTNDASFALVNAETLFLNDDGSKLFVAARSGNITEYNLSTPYDITTKGAGTATTSSPRYTGLLADSEKKYYELESTSARAFSLEGGEIAHTIPTGTFSSTLSDAFCTFKAEDWESGADVQFKLKTANPASINQNSFVEIAATSIDDAELSINGCLVLPKSAGVWILGNTSADDEVARAKILQTLFYGTDGTNPRIVSGVTSLSTIKTSVARDVDKQVHYFSMVGVEDTGSPTYTGTFANTTTNNDCSVWSNLSVKYGDGSANTADLEMPAATGLHSLSSTSNATSDEVGTDTSADETNNPATIKALISQEYTRTPYVKGFVLCEGDISWVEALGGSAATTFSNTDFLTDESIPVFTTGAALPSTQTDTGWLSTNEIVSFTALNNQPREFVVKLIPKTTNPTANYPSINGVALYADRPA